MLRVIRLTFHWLPSVWCRAKLCLRGISSHSRRFLFLPVGVTWPTGNGGERWYKKKPLSKLRNITESTVKVLKGDTREWIHCTRLHHWLLGGCRKDAAAFHAEKKSEFSLILLTRSCLILGENLPCNISLHFLTRQSKADGGCHPVTVACHLTRLLFNN